MSITNMRIALIIQVYSRVSVVSNLRVLGDWDLCKASVLRVLRFVSG